MGKINLQDFLFLFVSEKPKDARAMIFLGTDNDTWPKELRHSCISIAELYYEIRKYNESVLNANIREIIQNFTTEIADNDILTLSPENGYEVIHPFQETSRGVLVIGEIFLDRLIKTDKYRVVLHKRGEEMLPYILTIEAESDQDAITKAQKTIADIGWWGSRPIPIEYKLDRLVVKSVEKE